MKKNTLFLLLFISIIGTAQNDTIYKKGGTKIICTITLVNDNNIFYEDKKDNGYNINLSEVEQYTYKGKTVVLSQCFPINKSTGQIEIKNKVLIEGKSKDEIFNKIVVWATSKASNESQNGNVKDREAGIYKIILNINYEYKGGLRSVLYSITLQVENGYFDYVVNGFTMNKKPMEVYLREKEDDNYRVAFDDICKKMNYTLDELKQLK